MGVFEVVVDIVLAPLVMLLRVMLVLGIRRRPGRVRRRDICILIPSSLWRGFNIIVVVVSE